MSKDHEKGRKPTRVSEAMPVQVFLGYNDRARLDRLTEQLDTSKSEVLRRSLAALERALLHPAAHPALRIIGLVDEDDGMEGGDDAAVHHDRVLADAHDPAPLPRAKQRRAKP